MRSEALKGPAVLWLAVSLVLTACGAGREAEAESLAENFLADIRAGAWHAASSRMHSDMRGRCQAPEGLQARVEQARLQLESWVLTDISAFEHTGYVQVTLSTEDGRTRNGNLDLEREGEAFRVFDWRTDAQGLCGEA